MTSKRDILKHLWLESFNDPADYVDMYFDRVYNDADALTIEADGKIVSSLLLQRYILRYHGSDARMSYIAGASTRRSARGKGYMSRLIADALNESRRRGDMFCALIPAEHHLYSFYKRFGFATVFYNDCQCYTALHRFPVEGDYTEFDNHYSPEVYDSFHKLEIGKACTVLHSRRDFLNILDDLRFDGARFVAMADGKGTIKAVGCASEKEGMVEVKCLMGFSHNDSMAVLHRMRAIWPGKPFRVIGPPLSTGRKLHARGMCRIINVAMCLEAVAANNPEWESSVRVTDPLLAENNHIYLIRNGEVKIDDNNNGPIGFDVPINVLTSIVFSSESTGAITGFPSQRPEMTLMLD